MKLQTYLAHRRQFEILAVSTLLLLIVVINATSLGIEQIREGENPKWIEAWATETTSVFALGVLMPFLFRILERIQLGISNFRQRFLWLLPLFLGFSLIHVALFVAARKILWALADQQYTMDPLLLELIYELRKDFLSFLAIISIYYSYEFIVTRLQGEARFLGQEDRQVEESYPNQFLVKMLDREYLVRVDDIDWVQSARNYVVLNCGNRHYPMRRTLKRLNEELDPSRFLRVHRTAIVNLDRVKSLQDSDELEVELHSGHSVPVSRTYLSKLRAVLSNSNSVRV